MLILDFVDRPKSYNFIVHYVSIIASESAWVNGSYPQTNSDCYSQCHLKVLPVI